MICSNPIEQKLLAANIGALVLGFPKCGTTSLAEWLDASPLIDVSNPKETFQLCPEFDGNQKRSAKLPLANCFRETESDVVRMEATTLNVYSESLRKVLANIPHIKVILLTRNPADVVVSWHNQMRQAGLQFADDFEASWNHAVPSEASGESVDFLQQYHRLFQLGDWTQLWIDSLGPQRVMVVDSAELRSADPLHKKLNNFLQTDLELPSEIPVRNAYSAIRFPLLYQATRTSAVKSAVARLERGLPAVGHLRRYLRDRVFLKRSVRKEMATDDVRKWFAKDQVLVQQLLKSSDEMWKDASPEGDDPLPCGQHLRIG